MAKTPASAMTSTPAATPNINWLAQKTVHGDWPETAGGRFAAADTAKAVGAGVTVGGAA
jgi:hypothetical protein